VRGTSPRSPAADEPTGGEHDGRLQDDRCRLAQARGKQQDAEGSEDEADQEDGDGVERPRPGRCGHSDQFSSWTRGNLVKANDYPQVQRVEVPLRHPNSLRFRCLNDSLKFLLIVHADEALDAIEVCG
jgi:hypothetical protein